MDGGPWCWGYIPANKWMRLTPLSEITKFLGWYLSTAGAPCPIQLVGRVWRHGRSRLPSLRPSREFVTSAQRTNRDLSTPSHGLASCSQNLSGQQQNSMHLVQAHCVLELPCIEWDVGDHATAWVLMGTSMLNGMSLNRRMDRHWRSSTWNLYCPVIVTNIRPRSFGGRFPGQTSGSLTEQYQEAQNGLMLGLVEVWLPRRRPSFLLPSGSMKNRTVWKFPVGGWLWAGNDTSLPTLPHLKGW